MAEAVYRAVTREEEPEAMRLWTQVFNVPEGFFQTLLDVEEDRSLAQTRVAVCDGKIVSGLQFFYRDVRGLDGATSRMGGIANVATFEDARKCGHSGRLLQDAIEQMERDGCAWSMLFTGVNQHYARYGWKTVKTRSRKGNLRAGTRSGSGKYTVGALGHLLSEHLPELKVIHDEFDRSRPLSMVRSLRAWETAVYYRMGPESNSVVYTAKLDGATVAYAVVKREAEISLNEIGCRTGHERALLDIMDGIRADEAAKGGTVAHLWIPFDAVGDSCVEALVEGVETLEHGYVMARPIGTSMSMEDVEALFEAPEAIYWQLDNF
ncbi:MAG TPA: GNAT family N-acetyltransferase [Fimbriimonas sp.]